MSGYCPWARGAYRVRVAGQAGGPGAVAPGVLRGPAARGAQGRVRRLGRDGRRERVDPDPAAGPAPPDVGRVRPGAGGDVAVVRVPRCAGGRTGRATWAGALAGAGG